MIKKKKKLFHIRKPVNAQLTFNEALRKSSLE